MRRNLSVAREASGCALMAVVKAGAYGHGLEDVAKALSAEDIVFFGVANVGEARRIRDAGVETRIYLLGATWSEERPEIVARDWTPCISSLAEAAEFDALAATAGRVLKVHLAVDTGMGRGGFVAEHLPEVMAELGKLSHLEIEGLGSHLPSADEDEEFTRRQFGHYRAVISQLGGADVFKWRHLSNSAGLLGYDGTGCNLARPGLMLYGVSPLPGHQEKLSTVMSLKSRVTLVRTLPAGHGVSYGRQFVTTRPTRVATVGIGYGDGYPRHISGKGGEVWIRGRRFPILGRVTMDQTMVDVTDAGEDIREGDEVEMFGPNLPVWEVAEKAGVIVWEVFTGITPRVKRCYVG
ncbi:MAG: alanine racemase [Verrucomicrobiaceae bacterium]|nr:MAG: alanine racemase [Verrucomicrobiaceae bacterium]